MERVDILDDITWGKLVKTWATGRSYLDNGYLPPNFPRSIKEFNDQCAAATSSTSNIITKVPDSIVGIVVLQYSPNVLSLRLPPKQMVEAAEKDMKDGADYPIPQFYNDFYERSLELDGVDEKLKFHAARIGDYSIRNCA